jgi:nicotinate-nucleotide adenylyltransferase
MSKKVGLFFGSFNPIHVGHLILANHMAETTDLNEVWFVVSPHNPHKEKANLLDDYHRMSLVRVAIEDNPKLRDSAVEFELPKPSYTVFTLQKLKEIHPEDEFVLIMGEDNLRTLHKWKNYEYILENHQILVYPRIKTIQEIELNDKVENALEKHKNVNVVADVPMMRISSSFIRDAIKKGYDVQYLLTDKVFKYLDEMNFYK